MNFGKKSLSKMALNKRSLEILILKFMELSIQDLESIVSSFSNATDSDVIKAADQILLEWKQNTETLPTALEIIQSSNNKDLLLLSCIKIKSNFEKSNLGEEFDAIKTIFEVCIERIMINRSSHFLPENLLFFLFEIVAISTYFAPQLLEQILNSNQFSIDEQTCFYAHLLQELSSKDYLPEPQAQLLNFFTQNILDIFALLRQCDGEHISHSWVLLHCSLPKVVQSYQDLGEFIECLEIALKDDANVPIILDFYDQVLSSEDSEDYPYFKQLITIMVSYASSAFIEPSDLKVNATSFIWDRTIDLNFDFYGFDQINDDDYPELFDDGFINEVFDSFLASLPNFLIYGLDEDFSYFFHLLEIYTDCLAYQPYKVPLEFMMPYITDALDFIIDQIDIVSELSFPREDRLYPYCLYCDKMDDCLSKLMRLDSEEFLQSQKYCKNEKLEEEFNLFTQYISQYFHMKIGNLTNGVLYTFSFAPKKTRLFFSSGIGLYIKDMQTPEQLVTYVYFIENCCEFTPEVHRDEIDLTFTVAGLEYAPIYEVAKALVSLTKTCPQLFIEDGDTYIAAIYEMIEKAPVDLFLSNLFISMFNILYCFQEKYKSEIVDEETFQNIEEIFNKVRLLFEEKMPFNAPLNDVMYMRSFGQLIIPIIEYSKNDNDIMCTYYESLYEIIEKALSPMLLEDDTDFQAEICKPIKIALEKHWVANKEPYFQWIEEILSHTILPIHLSILSNLVEFFPSPKFSEFFDEMTTFSDEFMKEAIIILINVLKFNQEALGSLVNLDQILYPLESKSSDTLEKEFKLIELVINNLGSEIPVEEIHKIAQLVAQKAFLKELMVVDPNQYVKITRRAIKLLRIIGFKYNILGNTLEYISEAFGLNIQEMEPFATFYMQENDATFEPELGKFTLMFLNSPM